MSTKKVIITTVAVLLTLEMLFVAMLALFFPKARTGFVRTENFDQGTLNKVLAAQSHDELTDFENLLRLQLELDKAPNFTMTRDSNVTAKQSEKSYTTQLIFDTKEKRDNTINYQFIQLKGEGKGLADTFAPGNSGTKVVFDLQNKFAEVTKAQSVADQNNYTWNTESKIYTEDGSGEDNYIKAYGNWGNYMTDYFFDSENTIQNPNEKTVTYDTSTQLYTLTVKANASATEHYKNKIMTLGNGRIHEVNFSDACATITFQFDKNWKVYNYIIEENYQTITKIFGSITANTHATHTARFSY